ncbi:MAG: 50S ribosomal protein L17 [Candidatus Omnitrophica bacterium]|nr:50S ribosomal protein L17 [Candidatus Omnitrophota bacterium]
MRHAKRGPKLGRTSSHREAMLGAMVSSLIRYQRIRTTAAKASAAGRLADRMITLGKEGSLAARRHAFAILKDRSLVKMLFNEVAPLYKDRKGGYTRILDLGGRRGDGAPVALLELVEKRMVALPKPPKPKKEKKEESPKAAPKAETPAEKPAKPKAPPHTKPGPKDQGKSFLGKLRTIFRRRGGT